WATIGSSNLDPLSLSLNLEANVIVRHRGFNAELRDRLRRLIDEDCQAVAAERAPPRTAWRVLVSAVVFHVLRRFPTWAERLPAHRPRIESVAPEAGALETQRPLDNPR
ncbi:MAG TPA: phospholipase D-like domain-containing protein, partial [Albitalea sp.]|nr:phospholipase D-like domain-containing protein [Albitalea sp.]